VLLTPQGDTRVDRHETKSRSKKLRRRRGEVVEERTGSVGGERGGALAHLTWTAATALARPASAR
jgi:hypothetical protein